MPVNHAQLERSALCDLLAERGPLAETLCEGWTTCDLAAHLLIRERRPDAALGILAAPLAAHGESVRQRAAQQPFEKIVELIRSGPPWYSVMHPGPIDRAANTLEYFVHHEDVRRAIDGWEPRVLSPGLEAELWKILCRMGKVLARKAPVGVILQAPNRVPVTVKSAASMVTLNGEVGELVMFLEGRQAHTRLEFDGKDSDIEQLKSASFGI